MKVLNHDYKPRYIYHLSDIHIRLYHRLDDEYAHVFQQMYKLLETGKKNNEKCLVVITGDILHNKNDLSPECIMATLQFLNTLSSYYPTLFIAGNHDTLLNNLNRIDSLSAILTENNNPNLHYLKYSGFYQYGNVLFGVSSLLDNKMTRLQDDDIKSSPLKKVALYHGGVGKFSTNKGFVMEGIPLHTFDGYDAVMLGDIHLHQYLDKSKRIAYAGSMIAQNFGETDPHHGVLKWDMENCSSSLVSLHNPYRYCEAVLRGNHILMDGKEEEISTTILPEKCRLKIMVHGQKTTQDIHNIGILQTKFPMSQIHENVIMKSSTENTGAITTSQNGGDFLSVIHRYFNKLPEWSEKDKLFEIIMGYFKNNTTKTLSPFEILSVEFHYMFGYGPNNKIDFSRFKKNQTIGIFGMNSAGKSTLIDVILFLLYGNITRYKHGLSVPHEVIHFNQTKSSGILRFRSHNITYEIQKKMSRTKTKIKVDEKLFKILDDGSKLDMSEEHRKKTDKFVISQIGTPAQFLFTNVFLQSNENSFRSMTPKERKDFLYDILELSQLETHYQQNFAKWKENNHTILRLDKELTLLVVSHEQVSKMNETLHKLKEERQSYQDKMKTIQTQIREQLSQKKPCPATRHNDDMDSVRMQIKNCQQEIQKLEEKKAFIECEKQQLQIDRGLMETLRKDLRDLHKKVQVLPTIDSVFFQHQGYINCPTPEDIKCFRQDVYEQFLQEYQEITRQENKEIAGLTEEKERLLSSLYPEKETTLDTTLQQKLETIRKPTHGLLEKWKKKLQSRETKLSKLETKWRHKWDEWDIMQKEPDKMEFMSGLKFEDGCACCRNNQDILKECLLQVEEFKKNKSLLCQEITPSQEQYKQLQKEIAVARQKTLVLEQQEEDYRQAMKKMETIQHTLHNRSVKTQIHSLQQEIDSVHQVSKEIQDYKQMMQTWEHVRKIANKRETILLENKNVEEQIHIKEKELSKLEKDWDRFNKLQDLFTKTQSQWKDLVSTLEKLDNKMDELIEWKANREYNSQIDQRIGEMEQKEEVVRKRLALNLDETVKTQHELSGLEEKLRVKQEKEEQHKEISKENDFLQKLLHIIHRDKLPMYFLEQYLPKIQERINELIHPFLQQKKIVLRKEQKKENVDILLSVSTLGSETIYLGGMEGFIVDASIKEVLAEVALQSKSNFFMIDEGISALDKKQMENLDQFFQFLEERHAHVFIISHLNQAQHIVRHSLNISKEGEYSKIVYV